jgi:CelD/BcsL family acetyltransferase involved in cellulose biosynthesis
VAAWAAERGMLRLFFLRLDGRAVAVDYTIDDQGVRYMLKGGFDENYARQSPGTLLLEAGLKEAFEAGIQRVELGGGDDPYKLRWTQAVRERPLAQAFAPSTMGLVDWAAFAIGRPLAKRALSLRRDRGTS